VTDPQAAVEAYAAKPLPDHVEVVSFGDTAATFAPEAIAALRAVLDLHPPSTLIAGVMPDQFGPGRCCFCHLGKPVREYRDRPWPEKPELDMHEHTDLRPWCVACAGPEEESSQPWPCPTVRAITTALEAS
jgi:hypothetical protein